MQEKKLTKILKVKKVSIIGVIPSFAFQRAKYCALELHRKLPQRFPPPEIIGLLDLDWNEKLLKWRQTLGRGFWCLRRPVAVFFDGKFVGSDIELIKIVTVSDILLKNVPRKNMTQMKEHFRRDYITYLRKSKRTYCYLDICIDGSYIGTLTFQLYSDLLPRTCENFKCLCLGSRGPLLSYKGSRIHRIVKNGWIQGGDIQYKTGGGGFSIFCDPLEDEGFGISHDRRGVLSMANRGRHLNESQFFITLNPSTWMDTNFVAFGQLLEGSRVLNIIESIETMYECPLKKIEIKSCGKLDLGDVEDVDAKYEEVSLPKKKPKVIENISEQVVRLIMESLTDALVKKERAPDILDDGDVPSILNIQLYFQGLYSIPEDILEDSARYLRKLKRQLYRVLKPSATEIVEVLMYDLLMAVLTRMTTLDDIRETVGHELYNKMLGGINMELELCQKSYVKRLVDQIISTAQKMISTVTKKVIKMKLQSPQINAFQDKMQKWVQSFVLQETYKGDNYHISDRPMWNVSKKEVQAEEKPLPQREGKPCCELQKKVESNLNKLKAKFPSDDVCCIGSKLLEIDTTLSGLFSRCRYDLKRVPKTEEERMPLLDLIEISRYKLRWLRKKENAVKPEELQCIEKKVRKWMQEVVYTPETSWIKDLVFERNEVVFDHTEEILFGAMTTGLLEMYYFYDQYLKICGNKKQKLVERVLYPEDSGSITSEEEIINHGEQEYRGDQQDQEGTKPPLPACVCGHPCCVCAYDPNYRAPPPPPSLVEEEEEGEGAQSPSSTIPEPPENEMRPCDSDMELVDLNALLAEKINMKPEEIDVRSFRWLKSYIIEKGCDLKTDFVTQVHKWLDGDKFSCRGFISKHSMVTRASLLSLSISLAELIAEENQTKSEIKNFVYDLWDLYFNEMFKEALLENPPREEGDENEAVAEEEEEEVEVPLTDEEKCRKIIAQTPEFDFTKFCAKFAETEKVDRDENKEIDGEQTSVETVERDTSSPKMGSLDEILIPPPPPLDVTLEVPQMTTEQPETTKPEEKQEDNSMSSSDSEEVQAPEKLELEIAVVVNVKKPKKKHSPIFFSELVEIPSEDEPRELKPYVLPFWVKFLTEMTKQVLGNLAKVSRLPRRLYFLSDSDISFDDKMKEWFDFNAFNPQPTKGREIMDYIAVHHKSLSNLEETARSYLKKKKYSELLNRCTRITSANTIADEIVVDVLDNAMKDQTDTETVELYVSNFISTAVASVGRLNVEDEEEHDFDSHGKSTNSEGDD
ncbi:hypothetical protein RUM44_010618 [Polyplax serrata]|uniref:PPIase cyclophilin-type domain-containing protein n=1 Tax=Polyplax serrata TaxID=468196 RepID=A0ABR1AW03_POLSC